MFGPQRVGILRWAMCKCVTRDAFTHSRIFDKLPPVGIELRTLTPVAKTLTHLTEVSFGPIQKAPVLRPQNGTAALPGWPAENGKRKWQSETVKMRKWLSYISPFPFSTISILPRTHRGGPPFRFEGVKLGVAFGGHFAPPIRFASAILFFLPFCKLRNGMGHRS